MIVIADGKVKSVGSKEEIFPELMGEINGKCDFRGKADNE